MTSERASKGSQPHLESPDLLFTYDGDAGPKTGADDSFLSDL